MSYTVSVKEEISLIKCSKSEYIAELSAYIKNNSTITDSKISLTTENEFIIKRVKNIIKNIYNTESYVETIKNVNFSKKNLYQLTITNNLNNILLDLGIIDEESKLLSIVPDYIVGANEEIRAYLRGAFLATGSVSDPQKSRYHLELLTSTPEEAVFIQKLLNIFDLNAKILNRDKGYMVYLKEADKISDFLKILSASNAVLYFENVRIVRRKYLFFILFRKLYVDYCLFFVIMCLVFI